MKGITSEPNVQDGYFIRLQSRSGLQRTPMLLINVVGCHYLQVFGAAWNGAGRISVDPLCSSVSLLVVSCNPVGGVEKTAHVFAAIDAALQKLYRRALSNFRIKYSTGPYFRDCNLGNLTDVDNTLENKWLYEATTDGGEHVVVKFVRYRYGEDVHRYLNEKGVAPKLVTLPGNWCAVHCVVLLLLAGIFGYLNYLIPRCGTTSLRRWWRDSNGWSTGGMTPQGWRLMATAVPVSRGRVWGRRGMRSGIFGSSWPNNLILSVTLLLHSFRLVKKRGNLNEAVFCELQLLWKGTTGLHNSFHTALLRYHRVGRLCM